MNRQHQYGLTLVEMMIAVALSLILMMGVFKIMTSSKQTYALQAELATLQENARFVMDDISYNIRMAGYYGFSTAQPVVVPPNINLRPFQCANNDKARCNKDFPESDALTITTFGQDGKLKLRQYDPTIPEGSPNGIEIPYHFLGVAEADAKAIVEGAKKENKLQLASTTGSKVVYLRPDSIPPQTTIDGGGANYLIVSNFERAAFYNIDNVDTTNAKITLGNIYGSGTEGPFTWPVEVFDASKVKTIYYEVVKIDTAGTSDGFECRENTAPCYLLFKCANNPCSANEKKKTSPDYALLMEGVESLQIRYGVDSDRDGVVNTFVGDPVGNENQVVSVRVVLLMRTLAKRFDVEDTTDRIFDLDTGLSYAAGDSDAPKVSLANVYAPNEENEEEERGYRHRLFTSTIKVRNRN